ncbi:MAG TPA: PIN domain-containing protein [Tepidisphaeraceae bacterium]|jgi:uncharacterized protein YacL
MVLHVLRALFILLMAAVGSFFLRQFGAPWYTVMIAVAAGVAIVAVDILAPRQKLSVFSGMAMGVIVGLLFAFALSFVVQLVVDQYGQRLEAKERVAVVQSVNLMIGVICCYLSISFILQTKDDFRFVVPYIEFSKQTKGARPILLDTSVLIDGRITDITATGILESQLVVPRFVLNELQQIADSGDKLKRNRGRRGLDILTKLQGNKRAEVILYDSSAQEENNAQDVDQKLMNLAKELGARVLTNDFNLNKVAQLRGVDVININDLGNALKPVVLPGEKMLVRLLKAGEEAGQGVGYLEDGTMIVVEQGRQHLNEEVEFTVTSVLQTSAGRMIFGRMGENGPSSPARGRPKARDSAAT